MWFIAHAMIDRIRHRTVRTIRSRIGSKSRHDSSFCGTLFPSADSSEETLEAHRIFRTHSGAELCERDQRRIQSPAARTSDRSARHCGRAAPAGTIDGHFVATHRSSCRLIGWQSIINRELAPHHLRLALFQPQIAPNTGNIARLASRRAPNCISSGRSDHPERSSASAAARWTIGHD